MADVLLNTTRPAPPPSPAAPGGAKRPAGARPAHNGGVRGRLERPALIGGIQSLWQQHGIPDWHRSLYAKRFFLRDTPVETLRRENVALQEGTATVQCCERAIENRECVLDELVRLRLLYDDADFLDDSSLARRSLADLLSALRRASLEVVEGVVAWRRSLLAVTEGERADCRGLCSMAFATPSSRSARTSPEPIWPHGSGKEDYLAMLACNDTVVRTFSAVLELRSGCDPFLVPGGVPFAWHEGAGALLQVPALRGRQLVQVEAASMLLRDEVPSAAVSTVVEGRNVVRVAGISAFTPATKPELPPRLRHMPTAALEKLSSSCKRMPAKPKSPSAPAGSKPSEFQSVTRQQTLRPTTPSIDIALDLEVQTSACSQRSACSSGSPMSNDSESPSACSPRSEQPACRTPSACTPPSERGQSASLKVSAKRLIAVHKFSSNKPKVPTFSPKRNARAGWLATRAGVTLASKKPAKKVHESALQESTPSPTRQSVRLGVTFNKASEKDSTIRSAEVQGSLPNEAESPRTPRKRRVGLLAARAGIWLASPNTSAASPKASEPSADQVTISPPLDEAASPTSPTGSEKPSRSKGLLHAANKLKKALAVSKSAEGDFDQESQVSAGEIMEDRAQLDADQRWEENRRIREEKAMQMFARMKDNDESVHRDDLSKIIEFAGIGRPDPTMTENVLSTITQYNTLTFSEFIVFLEKYESTQRASFLGYFAAADADGSGTIDGNELLQLMMSMGLTRMTHVINDVIKETDKNGDGNLNRHEFVEALMLLNVREGFTLREFKALEDLFDRFDFDGSNELETKELELVLTYYGLTHHICRLESIIKSVDVDGNGLIGKREFINIMRKLQDIEINRLAFSMTHSELIPRNKLVDLLYDAGFSPDEAVVEELHEEMEVSPTEQYDLSRVYRFLTVYREREGLSNKDMKDIHEGLKLCCRRRGGNEIDAATTCELLRNIGYSIPLGMIQSLIWNVDIDKSGKLSEFEVRKLVRLCQESEVADMELIFDRFKNILGFIPEEDVEEALKRVRGVDNIETFTEEISYTSFTVPSSRSNDSPTIHITVTGIDKREFVRCARKMRNAKRDRIRRNKGCTDNEVKLMKEVFATFDQNGDGVISRKELVEMLQVIVPRVAHDGRMRPQLKQLLAEVDVNGDRVLDLDEFAVLMRKCRDEEDKFRLQKESMVVRRCDFAPHEVQQFREHYMRHVDNDNPILQFATLKAVVEDFIPLGDRFFPIFQKMVFEITAQVDGRGSSARDSLDFPEFLELMHKLANVDSDIVKESLKGFEPPKHKRRRSSESDDSDSDVDEVAAYERPRKWSIVLF